MSSKVYSTFGIQWFRLRLKNLKDFYLVVLGLQISYMNMSHKSRDCLLLSARVPDWKAIKPTLANLNSQTQQEVGPGVAAGNTERARQAGKAG